MRILLLLLLVAIVVVAVFWLFSPGSNEPASRRVRVAPHRMRGGSLPGSERGGSDLLRDLIWPAIAGNVIWSLVTLLAQNSFGSEIAFRAATLVLIGIYLLSAWKRDRISAPPLHPVRHAVFDSIFAAAICVFAIRYSSLDNPVSSWTAVALTTVIATALAGHVFEAWREPRPLSDNSLFYGLYSLGLFFAFIGIFVPRTHDLCGLFAVFLVLLGWWSPHSESNLPPTRDGA